MTKYGGMIEDHEWTDPEPEADGGDRTTVKSHDVEVILTVDPDPDYYGYGREKYEAQVSYDKETGEPFVLHVIEHKWKGNYWRDIRDWDWKDVPEPVRQQVTAVLPVDHPDELDPGHRLVEEGGVSRWETIHKPRMERMQEGGKTVCTVCGCDLTDPKNGGDPTEDDEWVCRDPHCRGFATPVCGPGSQEGEP